MMDSNGFKQARDGIFGENFTEDIFDALARHAALVDAAIQDMPSGKTGAGMPAVIAIGGYGRNELTPLSDIDLLFVSDGPLNSAGKEFAESVQRDCWALGLRPSASVRTLENCATTMREDHRFLTSLLERRLIRGDEKTCEKLDVMFREEATAYPKSKYIEEKLSERDARHLRMGDTRYQLQPHVKDGKGGLRDIQTLFWLGGFLYDARTPAALAERGILTPQEALILKDATAFFLCVRCHLQLLTNSPADRLSFDVQPEIARRMGYDDPRPNERAEAFMKSYFLMTNESAHLTRTLCAALETDALKGARKTTMRDRVDGFPVRNNRISVDSYAVFQHTPSEILRLFRASQTSGLGLHPDALRHVRTAKKDLTNDPEGMKTFMDILLHPKCAEQALRRMNEAGIIGALIPAFRAIEAHMQYDMYHVYTADEHTLRAIGTLHAIENGEMDDEAPLAAELFRKIHSRRALYAAMFLHDIAKGTGGLHSEKGANTAKDLCPALGLTPEETETAAWLVENHLLMTMTAYKRDLGDPQTLSDFTAAVQSPERLKLLTLITTADIIAVGPGRWNNWKAGLLSSLYHKALEILSGTGSETDSQLHLAAAQRKVRRLIGGKTDTLNMLVDYAPPYFWLSFPAETIASFISALHRKEDSTVIRVTPAAEAGYTETLVYAPNRNALFATLSGGMAAAGGSIVEARIFTLGNGMALDIFHVQTVNGEVYENTAFLKKTLKSAISGDIDLDGEIATRRNIRPARDVLFPVATRVITDNRASAVSTVIEVNGKDRPGFLYDVTSALAAENLQIVAAKIATFGSRAVDVFYVKDSYGLKVLHREKINTMEQRVREALEQERRA